MAATDQTKGRARLNWIGPDALLAALPLVHFALSVGVWLLYFGTTLTSPSLRPHLLDDVSEQLTSFGPAAVLLAVSVVAYFAALRRHRRLSRWLTAATIVAAGVLFGIDVTRGRSQVSVDIATKEYWDAGNTAHQYFTWWWYNDRWFANHAPGRAR